MIKVTIIIPKFDNNGYPAQQSFIDGCLEVIVNHCGGYTLEGACSGACRMDSGMIMREDVQKVWTVCGIEHLPTLRLVAADVAKFLGQECVYLEWHNVNVEFITKNGGIT